MSYFRKIMELFLFMINYNDDDANVFLLDVQALQWLLFYYLWVVTYWPNLVGLWFPCTSSQTTTALSACLQRVTTLQTTACMGLQ